MTSLLSSTLPPPPRDQERVESTVSFDGALAESRSLTPGTTRAARYFGTQLLASPVT